MKRFLAALVALVMAPSLAHAQAAAITSTTPPPPGGLICVGGFVYSFSGGAGPYQYLLGGSTCTGGPYPFTLGAGGGTSTSGAGDANNPIVGGPNSLQYLSARTALDLASVDLEGSARFDQGDADTIGGAGTYYSATGTDGERLEARYEKNWRPFEGSRTRALINIPVQGVIENSGLNGVSGMVSGGFEIPVQTNWSVTPRVGIGGATGSSEFGADGVFGTVSLGSRYRFPQIGRGDLVIGNLISYTGESAYGTNNVLFRNGIAYQFPIKQMMFGRQTSVRFSYVNTYIAGDKVAYDNYHEFAVNFGVRLREQDVRNRFEALRVGLLYTHADDYDSVTATLGYRF